MSTNPTPRELATILLPLIPEKAVITDSQIDFWSEVAYHLGWDKVQSLAATIDMITHGSAFELGRRKALGISY